MTDTPSGRAKFIDTKVPLVWLLSALLPVLWNAVQLYFTVDHLNKTVVELRATVLVLGNSSGNIEKELALLTYRVANIENQLGLYGAAKAKP